LVAADDGLSVAADPLGRAVSGGQIEDDAVRPNEGDSTVGIGDRDAVRFEEGEFASDESDAEVLKFFDLEDPVLAPEIAKMSGKLGELGPGGNDRREEIGPILEDFCEIVGDCGACGVTVGVFAHQRREESDAAALPCSGVGNAQAGRLGSHYDNVITHDQTPTNLKRLTDRNRFRNR